MEENNMHKKIDQAICDGLHWAKNEVESGRTNAHIVILLMLDRIMASEHKHFEASARYQNKTSAEIEELEHLARHEAEYEYAKKMYLEAKAKGMADMEHHSAVVKKLNCMLDDAKKMFADLWSETILSEEREAIKHFGKWLVEYAG